VAASSKEFVAFVIEQLDAIGPIHSERFFGGIALRSHAKIFAMIMDGTLYFAVDDALRTRLVALGSQCFSYASKKGRVDVKRFYAVPADTIENSEQLVEFAKIAIVAAASSSAKRKTKVTRSAR
jgi:DNA transformation protein and related proteins